MSEKQISIYKDDLDFLIGQIKQGFEKSKKKTKDKNPLNYFEAYSMLSGVVKYLIGRLEKWQGKETL